MARQTSGISVLMGESVRVFTGGDITTAAQVLSMQSRNYPAVKEGVFSKTMNDQEGRVVIALTIKACPLVNFTSRAGKPL
jgi:hypothetical protein